MTNGAQKWVVTDSVSIFCDNFYTKYVSDGRGNAYESVLVVAQFIHAYVSEEYNETTETMQNKQS